MLSSVGSARSTVEPYPPTPLLGTVNPSAQIVGGFLMSQAKYMSSVRARLEAGEQVDEVSVAMVTPKTVQMVVFFDTSDDNHVNGAWLLAHGVRLVAECLEWDSPPSYRAFLHSFTTAMSMVKTQKVRRQKKPTDSP